MSNLISKGKVKVKAPSNIAWVKYWGKRGLQLPMNPSISMTLSHCHTITDVLFELDPSSSSKSQTNLEFFFHGEKKENFLPKIKDFIARVENLYPFSKSLKNLTIHSENSFPHSSGIASSASAFCALAFAFENIQAKLEGASKGETKLNIERASEAARLGSGSACRSIEGGFNMWGSLNDDRGSDQHAIALKEVHPIFKSAKNAILIVSSKEKSVGSSAGHSLMQGHPYEGARIQQANKHCADTLKHLAQGNIWELGKIIENEAMSLHALMMTSDPSFILMEPETIKMIQKLREFRKRENVPVFFTLDAGPNPHILYLEQDKEIVENTLLPELVKECEGGKVIMDEVGEGSQLVESHFE